MVIEEFVAGECRADVAVVNRALHGYEIKSDSDTLIRLPAQIASYNSVFDYVTLVAGERHLTEAEEACPDWWGIVRARQSGAGIELAVKREPERNPCPDPVSIAWLLWRDEAMSLLEAFAIPGGRRKTRGDLANLIAKNIPVAELRDYVRNQLRERTNWRSGAVRM